jgi:two-component system sensor histidine kinase HydH
LYTWGGAPPSYLPPEATATNTYIENAKNNSLILLLRPSREGPLLPPPPENNTDPNSGSGHSFLFGTLRKADLLMLEIRQPFFWQRNRLNAVLFPTAESILAALVIFVRLLLQRNVEYRRRIEEQKNLVMLGTAASTLAHEIKNPLLAIRLQTSILARTLSGKGQREIEIIDDEVERLSRLSHRVNDILRDPAGIPVHTDPVQIAREVGMRLCGRDIAGRYPAAGLRVLIDPERLRSILENLVRNALESGGSDEEVTIEIARGDGMTRIDVLDRGQGIPVEQKALVFDPFFTTKSRGSGIGLAVCQRFVKAAKGTICIEDRPGGGSRARVQLPSAEER